MPGHSIRNVFLANGYFLSGISLDDDVRQFIRTLAPYETDKKLVRIGGDLDGGYLVPDDLDDIEYCFSPGVAKTARFESDLARKGVRSFLADYSVDGPPCESEMFIFTKKYIGATDDDKFMTLESWLEASLPGYAGDLILQMDIEGHEYDVIASTPSPVMKRFRVLVIEFHGLHSMFNRYALTLIRFCFRKLLADFDIVHMHPNNVARPVRRGDIEIPGVMEITFLRKDRVHSRKHGSTFPHPLDRRNVQGRKDLSLPECWYRSPYLAATSPHSLEQGQPAEHAAPDGRSALR